MTHVIMFNGRTFVVQKMTINEWKYGFIETFSKENEEMFY